MMKSSPNPISYLSFPEDIPLPRTTLIIPGPSEARRVKSRHAEFSLPGFLAFSS